MPRLNVVDPKDESAPAHELLQQIQKKMGKVPGILKGLANSPAALKAYMAMGQALADAALTYIEQRVVYLVTSEIKGCYYCVCAHGFLAKQKGLSDEEILRVRQGTASDPKLKALAEFTKAAVEATGPISQETLDAFHAAGYTDAHAAEVAVIAAQSALTNVFDHIHHPDVDFPKAPKL